MWPKETQRDSCVRRLGVPRRSTGTQEDPKRLKETQRYPDIFMDGHTHLISTSYLFFLKASLNWSWHSSAPACSHSFVQLSQLFHKLFAYYDIFTMLLIQHLTCNRRLSVYILYRDIKHSLTHKIYLTKNIFWFVIFHRNNSISLLLSSSASTSTTS